MLALTSKNIVPILGQFMSYNVTYQNHAPPAPTTEQSTKAAEMVRFAQQK